MINHWETEEWKRWFYCTTSPVVIPKHRSKVSTRGRVKWITYHDKVDGKKVIVEMPEDAPTKSCHEGRHDDCPHRLGQRAEGGVHLKINGAGFIWRCGCSCHYDPMSIGRLF
ncbi:hypothetical protein VXE65_02680 [Mycolicibacterium conceptionense]|uniref:hypothetical protein n=1 Tax=Mycolicibacterium conceptionense TaxID=451644 RepID=UPI003204B407